MAQKYDLVVAYRCYPGVSKDPLFFKSNKFKLTETCLRSFNKGLGDVNAKIIVLLDKCPKSYELMFRKILKNRNLEIINLPGIGNAKTFELQIDKLVNQNDSDLVYFAEDDYLYLPNSFKKMINFIKNNKNIDFISAYDHLDYYQMAIHRNPNIMQEGNQRWRVSSSTCLTFLAKKKSLKDSKKVFLSYTRKNRDVSVWLSLTKINLFNPQLLFKDPLSFKIIGYTWFRGWQQIIFGKKRVLVTPLPSLATHIESTAIAPGIAWKNYLN